MRAVIIGNGDIHNYEYIKSKLNDDDFIICADGGIRHTKHLGIKADVAVGDFDSGEKCDDITTYVYPTQKDYTDGEIAIDYALRNGYSEILLVGMTGSRLDHTFTNIFQLVKDERITLIDDDNEIYLLKSSQTFKGKKGKTLSIIPVYGDLKGVSAKGLFYPLSCDTLYFGQGRGNSNIITEDICTVSVKSGIGLIFINDGQ